MSRTTPYCNMCGDCCHGFSESIGVTIFPSDAKRISDFLSVDLNGFISNYCYQQLIETEVGNIELNFLIDNQGCCCFLTSNKCSIHDVKPAQCKKWPDKKVLDTNDYTKYTCQIEGNKKAYKKRNINDISLSLIDELF